MCAVEQPAPGAPAASPATVGASLLRNVPVLSGLPRRLLADLATRLGEIEVAAGEWVIREGEPADSLFIVRSGRLEVVDEGPPESLLRVLRRGDVLGELALLQRGPRTASARARRDVELLELSRDAFEELIEREPRFALGLTRSLGAQLAATRMPLAAAQPPRSIAVLPLEAAAPAAAVAELLAAELARFGSVATLGDGGIESIETAEMRAERVVLSCGAIDERWGEVCLAEADLLLAVSTGGIDAGARRRSHALHACELLTIGPALPEGAIELLQPRQAQVIADGAALGEALGALSRRIAGRSLGIVLSGGGARALAHIGVLDELREHGLHFDRIAGVSLGSLVAAAVASGMSATEITERFEQAFLHSSPSNDFAIPAYSLIRGAKARRLLEESFGAQRIEELPLRFFCLSCDLVGREAVVHDHGRLVDAVYPSLAIPGVFPPVATPDGRLLVDGGVLDNLPVATMARKGEGPVIAVDVTGRMTPPRSSGRPRLARLGGATRRVLTGSETPIPHLGETIVRAVTVGSIDTVAAARVHADAVITPAVEGTGLVDWQAFPRMVELGREAARQALASGRLRDWVAR